MAIGGKIMKERQWKPDRLVTVLLLTGLGVLVVAYFFSQQNLRTSTGQTEALDRNYAISAKLREMENFMLASESNMQQYFHSNDFRYLPEIERNNLEARRKFDEVESIMRAQYQPLSFSFITLRNRVDDRLSLGRELLDTFKTHGRERATQLLLTKKEDLFNENFQIAIDDFQREEGINLSQQQKDHRKQKAKNILIDNLGFLLAIGLLLVALIYLLISLRKRMKMYADLAQAKEKVENLAQIKEQFLANMSHEIRTPLQAILGFSSLLSKEQLSSKQLEYVNGIEMAGSSLLAIVNDVLDASKMEAGMIRLEEIPFSISGLLHSVIRLLELSARKKGLEIHFHFKQLLPDILIGDPTRLTQILINLIGNAIKFTDQGQIDIWVDGQRIAPDQFNLQVKIKDTGIGITTDRLPYIFDRFEQADNKVTRVHGGSGLGLFITRELVVMQGGHIGAESEKNKGSNFYFNIPYHIASQKSTQQNSKEKAVLTLNGNFQDIKLLVVEDSLMNQRVVGAFLEEWGIDYDLATNGMAAIQCLEEREYDLVLMDVQMPEMDGYSATEYIRENMSLKVPIIAMTAHALAGEREKALSFGMNEYISKPIRQEDLYQLIGRFIPLKVKRKPLPEAAQKQEWERHQLTSDDELNVDYNYLLFSSKGKKAYLRNILSLFIRQAPGELVQLKEAAAQKDFSRVGEVAHRMKSTVGYVGLNASLLPLLEQIEVLAKTKPENGHLDHTVANLDARLQAAIEKLKKEVIPLIA